MLNKKHNTLNRVYYINNVLLQTVKTIYRLRKVGFNISGSKPIYAYSISMAKDNIHTIWELVNCFYTACKKVLIDNEQLITGEKCLKIVSDEFELYYCMEFWRKSADKIAYIEDNRVKVEFLHRMSCEQAAYIFKKYRVEPFELLNTLEIFQKYNNPADKYCALAKMPILLKETHSIGEGK